MTKTHYEVLGVASTASSAEIKSAYRNMAMIVHPDQGGPAALFQRVSMAYEVLADPARRDSYDLSLAARASDPCDYQRHEQGWPTWAETRRAAGAQPQRGATAQRTDADAQAPPRQPQDETPTGEQDHPERPMRAREFARQAGYIHYMIRGAALSIIGFWVVQIPWLVIDDDLDDVSDVWNLSRWSWWILAFAAVNLGLAFRTRARKGRGQPCASAALATIVCSGLMLLVFVAHGARSDDLGVWPAAMGAAISAVGAALFRRGFSQLEDSSAGSV
jgi:hypothetical protein